MSKIKNSFFALVLCCSLLGAQVCIADEADVLIPSVAPDVLFLLDLSGSMNATPVGVAVYASSCPTGSVHRNGSDGPYYNTPTGEYTVACTQPWRSREHGAIWGDSQCLGPYYKTSGTGHTRNCSKIQIAKDAIKSILDADGNETVASPTDDNMLGIRIGYGNFSAAPADEPNSTTTYVNVPVKEIGSLYSNIWSSLNAATCDASTPLANFLNQAKTYLDANKAVDPAGNCRKKFALLITDGSDTATCSGDGNENQLDQYKRRRETVAKAKALGDAGYLVYVVGFGASMPHYLKNTLNWAAFYGGTDNPTAEKSGDTGAYNPSSVTSCDPSTTANHNIDGEGAHNYATSNDPGEAPLSGYAFTATDLSSLKTALQTAFAAIRDSTISFSLTAVSSSRTALDNHLYAASFQPKADPFWPGYLKEYTIDSNGNLQSSPVVNATIPAAGSRTIRTLKSGSTTLLDFTTANLAPKDIGFHDNSSPHDAQTTSIIGFIRGESAYNIEGWKLGDIFHSNPVTITSPNPYYNDTRDTSSPNRFGQFRTGHQRTHDSGRVVIAGANDGQLHAIRTSDMSEVWSFVPPNLLPKLQLIAHNTHPTVLPHRFFVDGPISAGDVWLGTEDDQKRKSAAWNTLLVFGEGKGVRGTGDKASFLWSSQSNCAPTKDDDFNYYYHSDHYPYYCGYYALNVTDTSNPTYAWHLNPTASQAAYLDEPWSKMAIGKVLKDGYEKWVGFIGGGYTNPAAYDVTDPTRDTRGKGFFVVDLSNGNILWSFTKANDGNMTYSIPASPVIVDTDNDGFIDTAYVGDLGGNMWRFKFCTNAQGSCGTGSWSGGLLFQKTTTRPIYTAATASRDWNSNLWVFWGTGDKMSPNSPGSGNAGKFFAVKDNSRSGSWTESDLQDIAAYTDTSPRGWSITLNSAGEKMLSDPTVFGGMLLFTTYLPYAGTNPCVTAGTAYLYAVAMQQVFVPGATYNTGAGLLDSGARSVSLGSGIASAPTIAQSSPGATSSLFVSVSGGLGIVGETATTLATVTKTKADFDSTSGLIKRLAGTGISTQILHWRDGRIQ